MKRIALCPGHRKEARGAVNARYGLNEHDEACKVVNYMAEILSERGFSIHIFKGRLSRKIANVNAGNFDLALDIHFNAGGGKGCEVVHVPGSPARHAQATLISATIAESLDVRDRGAKSGWWWGGALGADGKPTKMDAFVSQTDCPAFIPEPLFIDNDAEVEKWLVAGRHEQIAEAIAGGIITAGF